jgi:protein SCO1
MARRFYSKERLPCSELIPSFKTSQTMRRLIAILLTAACTALLIVFAVIDKRHGKGPGDPLAALTQTYIAVEATRPVSVPHLITADGSVLAPERLQGHWSVIFFGFTACPLVCPRTLAVLTAVAHNSESGISSGTTQPVFVSVDTEHDTPKTVRSYLDHFDRHILGLTGTREAVGRFSREIGAGFQSVGSGIDHSTSLFVLDPKGRLAGILLRPNDPARIIADLTTLRRSYAHTPISLAR